MLGESVTLVQSQTSLPWSLKYLQSFSVFVKKQLNSGISFHRRMGVVGTVICVRAMIQASSSDEDSWEDSIAESSREDVPTGLLAEAHELISSAQRRTQFDPELAGLLLDELCFLTDDKTCTDFIKEMTAGLLKVIETNYVEEVEEIDNNQFSLPMISEMGLDDEDNRFCVVFAKKVLACSGDVSLSSDYKKKMTNLSKLIPTLRLFTKSRRLSSDDKNPLRDVDALLGCCLLMFPRDVLNNMRSHSAAAKNSI